jgi:hypothetical protein
VPLAKQGQCLYLITNSLQITGHKHCHCCIGGNKEREKKREVQKRKLALPNSQRTKITVLKAGKLSDLNTASKKLGRFMRLMELSILK